MTAATRRCDAPRSNNSQRAQVREVKLNLAKKFKKKAWYHLCCCDSVSNIPLQVLAERPRRRDAVETGVGTALQTLQHAPFLVYRSAPW
jgi:hypothetical protein